MTISTKGRYALRMIVDLAEHSGESFVALKDIAVRQGISKKYLEQIVPPLNNGGVLTANRGFSGGYKLAKPAKDITVGDIIRMTDGNLVSVTCAAGGACDRYGLCATAFVWQELDRVINDYLDSVTVQDILDRRTGGDDYCI